MPNRLLDAALAYARAGISVIPCESARLGDKDSGKKPLLDHWTPYQSKVASEKQIIEWWTRWPNANIGIACGVLSGYAVLDVDPRHGGMREKCPPTGIVAATPGGGWHMYYTHPGVGQKVSNEVNSDPNGPFAGIDVRGDGGYVIAPPSNHWQGGTYEWEQKGQPGPWKWLRGKKDESNGHITDPGAQWIARALIEGIHDGSRNVTITKLAGYLAGKGVSQDIAEVMLQNLNERSPDPLDANEITKSVKSIYKAEYRKNGETKKAAKEKAQPLDLMPFAQYAVQYENSLIQWLISEWVPFREVGMIVAEPEAYKTWIEIDMAVSIASGTPFMNQFEVEKDGPVVYLNLEDSHPDTVKRFTCITRSRFSVSFDTMQSEDFFTESLPNLPIYFHPSSSFQLGSDEAAKNLEEVIEKLKPRALMIDPLYQVVPNLDDYMVSAVKHLKILKEWREKYDLTTIIVHHRKKAQNERDPFARMDAWGSQLINAFLGFGYQVARTQPQRNVVSLMRHFKNAPPGKILNLEFDIDTKDSPWKYEVSLSDYMGPKDGDRDIPNLILNFMRQALRGMTPAEVASALDITEKESIKYIKDLIRNNMVVSDNLVKGAYRVANLTADPPINNASEDEINLEDGE